MHMRLNGRLVPVKMMHVGSWPKMLLHALKEIFHVYHGMGADDNDGLHMVAQEMLSLTLFHCMECRGKPMPSSQTSGTASSMVDVNDELLLEWLAQAIYDGMLELGHLPHSRDNMIGHGSWQECTVLFTKVVGPKTIVPPALHHPSVLCKLLGALDDEEARHPHRGLCHNPQCH